MNELVSDNLPHPFEVLDQQLALLDQTPVDLAPFRGQVQLLADAAVEAGRDDLSGLGDLLLRLTEVLACMGDPSDSADGADAGELVRFLSSAVSALKRAWEGHAEFSEIAALDEQARSRWGDWIDLLDEDPAPDSGAEQDAASDDLTSEDEAAEATQLDLLLSALAPRDDAADTDTRVTAAQDEQHAFSARPAPNHSGPPAVTTDPALLEAYMDDAHRCLAAMEAAILEYEQEPTNLQPLVQVCRELHTLKGASASVGLADLAAFLHALEEELQGGCDAGNGPPDIQRTLGGIDQVRRQVSELSASTETPGGHPAAVPAGRASDFDAGGPSPEETIRVRASQLDRLMDMLAELVMLRNRRESGVTELQRFNDELIRCSSRLRVGRELATGRSRTQSEDPFSLDERPNPFPEIANDIQEIAQAQRGIGERIATENSSVSRFIRQFRHELVQLRRLPLSGLFQRLQRVVRDAARAEQKQVRLELVGAHAGLERSLQERLYEPLLHILRNAVSHGIEPPVERESAGKDPEGTVVLEAHGGTNLLLLEIRDDGRGLNYDALRRRGIELGLIAADHPASRAELAQLIFRPGFSTRKTASEVSGRGVGMDVVATTLEKMRSWIEVDSSPGKGTCIRLSIPLRSVIEHTMLFRSAGQLFALPMQFVYGVTAEDEETSADGLPQVELAELLNIRPAAQTQPAARIVLGSGGRLSGTTTHAEPERAAIAQRFALLVDELVGPEEVVVRPLPQLLRHQRLFSGVTLSGTGEVVLLFDPPRLVHRGLDRLALPQTSASPAAGASAAGRARLLVVDDSLSARRALIRALQPFQFEILEAADGLAALDCLRAVPVDAVFTDVEMPRLGGLDLLREIKTSGATREIPVVVVSSRSEEPFRARARELGASAYLTKPVTVELVTQTIQRLELRTCSKSSAKADLAGPAFQQGEVESSSTTRSPVNTDTRGDEDE